jgi:zinc protease
MSSGVTSGDSAAEHLGQPGQRPASLAGSSQVGLGPVRTVLDNGIVVLAKETNTTPAVTINLTVRSGFISDPPDAPGAMYLMSRVIDRGAAGRTAAVIAEELDSRGISLALAVTRHLFSIVCTCLAEDFDPVLDLLADILISPSFPDGEIATRKGEVITSIRQDEDNPAVRAVEGLMALLYPDGHPYGRRPKGTVEVVDALGRDQLVALHTRSFAPGALTAVIVGDVSADAAAGAVARVLGAWRHPPPPPIVVPRACPAARRQRVVLPMMNKVQTDIAYGFTAIRRSDPDYYAFWLMNNALGQYAIGGRLGDSIRERQGMAYYVFSSLDADVIEGPLLVRAGVSPANVDRAIASIDDELERVTREGLSQKELNDSRQYLIGSMPRMLETNAGIANFLQTAELFGLGPDYDLRLPGLLGGVTADDTNAAARRILNPERATVVVAGPYEE